MSSWLEKIWDRRRSRADLWARLQVDLTASQEREAATREFAKRAFRDVAKGEFDARTRLAVAQDDIQKARAEGEVKAFVWIDGRMSLASEDLGLGLVREIERDKER